MIKKNTPDDYKKAAYQAKAVFLKEKPHFATLLAKPIVICASVRLSKKTPTPVARGSQKKHAFQAESLSKESDKEVENTYNCCISQKYSTLLLENTFQKRKPLLGRKFQKNQYNDYFLILRRIKHVTEPLIPHHYKIFQEEEPIHWEDLIPPKEERQFRIERIIPYLLD